ncbi:MAG: beta-lactamase family protein [Defluviitaleaceae bacterium]|nr:beta-lactamase family protein [Defluviitaleaceae bacterium]
MKSYIKILAIILILIMPSLVVYGAQSNMGHTPSGVPFYELEARVDALMSEHINISTPGAAIVVVQDGEIIFSRGYGFADIENRIPIDPARTVFEVGSINKPFIWVSVMQLVERNLLDLDKDVRGYLPDSFQFEKPFTMRDLLNHKAGFADFLLALFVDEERLENFGTLEEILLDTQPPQIFAPGMVSAYSNWGSALAAFIVQYISEQSYADYELENILLPLGMQNTLSQPYWLGNYEFLSNKAMGYTSNGQGVFREGAGAYIPLYPSGSMKGTAEDLAAFIIGLTPRTGESGPLFSDADTLETLFSSSSLDPVNFPGTHHGFFNYSGVLPAFGHGGGTASFSADFAIVPDARFGFAILTNSVGHMDFMPTVRELLIGGNQEVPIAGSGLPNASEVEGRFLTARRYYGNFLEFVSYTGLAGLSMVQVSAVDDNKIELSIGMIGTAVYVQTEPYVFRFYESHDSPLFASNLPELRFRLENGVPVQIHLGGGGDFTHFPEGRTLPFLIASLVILVLCAAFFIIIPIVLLILFFIRRRRGMSFDRFNIAFLLSGTMLLLNNLALFGRFGLNPFRAVNEVAFHIWFNCALVGIAVILCCIVALRLRSKIFFCTTFAFLALLVFILHNWNFFVLL